MSDLKKGIERAWELKVNQRIEECLSQVSSLKQQLGLPTGLLTPLQLENALQRVEPAALAEVLLLSASLARTLGNLAETVTCIERAERCLAAASLPASFHLCFEKGMYGFVHGHYSTSMEEFLAAAYHAKSDFDRLCALVNTLFCMYNLSLPYEKTLKEVHALLKTSEGHHELEGIRNQLDAMEVRSLFHKGEVQRALQCEQKRKHSLVDQAKYFTLWLRALPYHRYYDAGASTDLEDFSLSSPYFQHRSYRLHTLQGILHPDDLKLVKLSELIDRLYLWVWRWLQSPDGFPIQKVMLLLRDTSLFAEAHRLTSEDRQQLRNALLWMGVFDPTSESQLKGIVASIMGVERSGFALFELEHLGIHYCLALRDRSDLIARDFRRALESHPLWESKELHFKALFSSLGGDDPALPASLKGFSRSLRTLIRPEETEDTCPIVVDMNHLHVLDRRSGQKTVSQSLCLALHLMRNNPSVSCEEFSELVFNLRHYDSLVHNGKIFNLLSRMKQLLPEDLRFRMKSGAIIADGRWDRVHFRMDASLSTTLRRQPEWRSLLYQDRGFAMLPEPQRRRADSAPLPDWCGTLTRKEVEQRLGKPRSTTNRILLGWVKQGLVIQQGKARATCYRTPAASPQERTK